MSVSREDLKRRAAEAAFPYVRSGMTLGLGTGSTVAPLVDLLGEAVTSGTLTDIVAVPTSNRTQEHALRVGIPLIALSDRASIDLTIDGADEITPGLDLIKGAGGALLREKMVAQASDRLVIVADVSKAVDRLGSASALPLEVVEWGWQAHVRFLESFGAEVAIRRSADGSPLRSDNGNLLLDCTFPDGIEDAELLDEVLGARAGIVESGLFLGLADEALLASEHGMSSLRRPA